MEDIISKVLDIEHEAQTVVKSALEKKEHLSDEMEGEAKKTREELTKRMNARILHMEEEEVKIAEEKTNRLLQEYSLATQRLDKLYEENKEKWADMLFGKLFPGEQK